MAADRFRRSFRPLAAAAFAFLLLAFLPVTARADAELTPEFRRDIAELMKITGSDSLGLQMGGQMADVMLEQVRTLSPEIPASTLAIIREEVLLAIRDHMPELLALTAEPYAKHLTHDEVRQLIAFYRTPLGTRFVRELPGLMQDLNSAGRAWGETLAPELIQRVQASLGRLDAGEKK